MDTFWAILAGVVPSIGVGLLFWFAMRKIVRADRNERAALAKLDAEEAERYREEQRKAAEAS
ncbi:hypothetical protein Xcel_2976 [Xylanimonas cellulosilytica DSM 15894]|uniref:Uncharacterized protein n=1 Tax=Xylanimonas cellulosilytica (strain DSM 15894 / JCM 12276 / CECT 5975 / KCTC 9989 / LMG 20990 / NBRC 107835 / XIL07) TaxID=446471 RepID=D1BZ85_XYLCX|nr:hypothetical protein [Xylanimonas cellulosilytica]ACZ31982.1 hypothetical protein Xcel_2976 [Xylanimonas cellulosilytica DSM 15894]